MTIFDSVWSWLQGNLKSGQAVKNWTASGKYLGDTMKIVGVRSGYIEVNPPNAACTQMVPKKDFMKVWEVWSDYKSGKLPRSAIGEKIRYTKYIISILHWYEQEEQDRTGWFSKIIKALRLVFSPLARLRRLL